MRARWERAAGSFLPFTLSTASVQPPSTGSVSSLCHDENSMYTHHTTLYSCSTPPLTSARVKTAPASAPAWFMRPHHCVPSTEKGAAAANTAVTM